MVIRCFKHSDATIVDKVDKINGLQQSHERNSNKRLCQTKVTGFSNTGIVSMQSELDVTVKKMSIQIYAHSCSKSTTTNNKIGALVGEDHCLLDKIQV